MSNRRGDAVWLKTPPGSQKGKAEGGRRNNYLPKPPPPSALRLPPWFYAAALLAAGCEDLPAPSPPVVPDAPSAIVAVIEDSTPVPARPPADPDRLLDRTFDDIKFDIEPDDAFDRGMLTDEIRALEGQRMKIRGYIYPTAQKRGIKQFVLVRDNQECCFGPGAALYDCILVAMEPGTSAEFSVRPVAVEGRFSIEELDGPDGRPLAIYRLAGESVE